MTKAILFVSSPNPFNADLAYDTVPRVLLQELFLDSLLCIYSSHSCFLYALWFSPGLKPLLFHSILSILSVVQVAIIVKQASHVF